MPTELIKNPNEITPVIKVGGLLVKRDDLFCPFESGGVNGGKLRQCVMLVQSIGDVKGLVTYCSKGSPQAPIVAAVGKSLGIESVIVYGGTKRKSLQMEHMARLVSHYGGKICIGAKTGRHNVLHKISERISEERGYFLVQYGINLSKHKDVLLSAVAKQTRNIPDCENLVAVCGSGITASGILIGLKQNGIKVKNVHLVATAPDRRQFIQSITEGYGASRKIEYHDLFHQKGFSYDKPAYEKIGNIALHPNYEGKAFRWFRQSGLSEDGTVFWITGAKPRIAEWK